MATRSRISGGWFFLAEGVWQVSHGLSKLGSPFHALYLKQLVDLCPLPAVGLFNLMVGNLSSMPNGQGVGALMHVISA
jgi:hypothetical protein